MHQDDQGIVPRRDFNRALGQQPPGVAPGDEQFRAALEGDQRQHGQGQDHAAAFTRESPLAVNPGPRELRNSRSGGSAASTRSSTNSTVGADMLP